MVAILLTVFAAGRYTAHGAAGQTPVKLDQFLVAFGMVKVTMNTIGSSQERIIKIAKDQMSGRLTKSAATKAFEQAIEAQQAQVGQALIRYANGNMIVSKDYLTGPDQLSNDMLHTVEYLQTKYPQLFNRFMN